MNRKIALLTALLLAPLTLFAACAGSDASDKPESYAARNMTMSEPGLENGAYDRETMYLSGGAGADSTAAESLAPRKIIWDASMEIEAEEAAGLHGNLAARAAGLGGYEHANDIRHYELYSVVYATFKIPPQNLQAFMAYAGEAGKVVNSSLGSEDVTEGYYDAQTRLESKRRELERYYALLSEAENLDEILRVQRIIDGIIAEIEAFEGKLRLWDVLTEMATVSVTIRQRNDPVKLRPEINWKALSFGDMGYLIQRGFIAVSGGALTVLQWIFVAALVASPLWIVGLPVLWVLLRRRKKRRAAMPPEELPTEKLPTDSPR